MPEKPAVMQCGESRRPRPEPEPLEVSVLYEDESLIAIDKAAGMVVHPTYRNWSGTLLNALLWRLRDRPGVLPRIVTRLDKNTSGLVVIALSPEIHARIQRDAAAGHMTKEYLAVVRGVPSPSSGTIVLPLARSPQDRRRVIVTPDGQPSETRYETVSSAGGLSLLRCELVTGRTHQIRVHLAARGWPIVGDPTYQEAGEAGKAGRVEAPDGSIEEAWDGLTRQALHAWRVRLPHPVSREPLQLDAPLPPDLLALVARLS